MPLLEKWTPLRELDLVDRRMRRFFEDLGVVPALAPAADVYETAEELVVELEVPGFDVKELEIEISDHTLSIAGERREVTETTEKALRLHERLEKKFERRFALPAEIDGEHIKAEYLKGVLTVHVPKTARPVPRKVEIAKT
jgi:HSP20 family protein